MCMSNIPYTHHEWMAVFSSRKGELIPPVFLNLDNHDRYSTWKAIFDTLTISPAAAQINCLKKLAYFFGLIWLSTGFYAKCFRVLRWHFCWLYINVDERKTLGQSEYFSPWNSSWWFPYLFITIPDDTDLVEALNPPGPQQKILHWPTPGTPSTWINPKMEVWKDEFPSCKIGWFSTSI